MRRQAGWYRNYVETMVQRDVRDLARIASLDTLPRLFNFSAGQTARLIACFQPICQSSQIFDDASP